MPGAGYGTAPGRGVPVMPLHRKEIAMIVLWIVLGLLCALLAVLLVRALLFHAPRAEAVAPAPVEVDANEAARALSELVRCKTVSHADAAEDDLAEFDRLTALLPALFRVCTRFASRKRSGTADLFTAGRAQAPKPRWC